jgi:hypothetical protein
MNSVGPDLAGVASGVNNAVSRTAALLAIACFGVVMAWAFGASLADQLARIDAAPDVLASVEQQRDKLAGVVIPSSADVTTAAALKRAVDLSFVAGFRWVMLLCAVLALLSTASAWLLIDEKPRVESSSVRLR